MYFIGKTTVHLADKNATSCTSLWSNLLRFTEWLWQQLWSQFTI